MNNILHKMSENNENNEYQEIEKYINNINKEDKISLMMMKAELSTHYFSYAKKNILAFFNNKEKKFTTIGYSSGSMRSHHLYKATDDIIYEIHYSYGKYSYCSYLTPSMISMYFDEGEELPIFIQPLEVQKQIDEYYEYIKEFNSSYEEINI